MGYDDNWNFGFNRISASGFYSKDAAGEFAYQGNTTGILAAYTGIFTAFNINIFLETNI